MTRPKQLITTVLTIFLISLSQFQLSADVKLITDTISPNRFKSTVPIKSIFELTYAISKENEAATEVKSFLKENTDFTVDAKCIYDVKHRYKTNHKYTFDKNGFLIQEKEYDSPSHVATITNFVYTGDNLLTQCIKEEDYFGERTIYINKSYEYTPSNRLQSKSVFFPNGKLYTKGSYAYDANNNITFYQEVDYNGELTEKTIISYDMYQNGKIKTKSLKECEYLLEYDAYVNNVVISYDDSGKCISKHQHSNYLKRCRTNEYDSLSRLVRVDFGHTDLQNVEDLIKYDEQNRIVYTISKFKELPDQIVYYYYDENSQQVAIDHRTSNIQVIFVNGNITQYYDGKNLYEYKYIFDPYQNWVTATEYKNGIPVMLKERQIEYFN